MKTEQKKILEQFIAFPSSPPKKKEWDWRKCVTPMKKGDKKENISKNIDALLYA